jgi:hypothetical protein
MKGALNWFQRLNNNWIEHDGLVYKIMQTADSVNSINKFSLGYETWARG